ncbi:aryl-sulfate sulfotransferase [bacterium]|nr:aryl-sulfate sulfotransferase [bacterium]
MNKLFTISLVLLVLLCVSCENKVSVPTQEIADEDSDVIPDDDADSGNELISDLKIEENKENSLSCRLTFSTTDERKTFVKYYSDTHKGYKIAEKEGKNDHYFFLWGMRENLDYTIEIYSDEEEPELLATTEFHSGKAPSYLPLMSLTEHVAEKTSEGFVLFQYAATTFEHIFPVAVMVDTDGYVVWYYEYDPWYASSFGDVAWNPENQTILIALTKDSSAADSLAEEAIKIDLEGNILWEAPGIKSYYYGPGSWNHAYYMMNDGSVTFPQVIYDGCIVTDRVVNLDADTYGEIWSWDYRDYFEKPDCSENTSGDVWLDWTHTNSVTMYKEEGIVYINSRNFSTLFKIDMSSGAIIWRLGKDGDFMFIGDNEYPWFEVSHDPEINGVNGNKVIFYDNGSLERGFTRIVEYTIDEYNMTAEISFEFDGSQLDKRWWSEYWGDADRLENDNIFVTAGFYDMQQISRFFEVTPDGEIVWELLFEKTDDWQVSLYKADKFVPPLEFIK